MRGTRSVNCGAIRSVAQGVSGFRSTCPSSPTAAHIFFGSATPCEPSFAIGDEMFDALVSTGAYLKAMRTMLKEHRGLWFSDDSFVVSRRHD